MENALDIVNVLVIAIRNKWNIQNAKGQRTPCTPVQSTSSGLRKNSALLCRLHLNGRKVWKRLPLPVCRYVYCYSVPKERVKWQTIVPRLKPVYELRLVAARHVVRSSSIEPEFLPEELRLRWTCYCMFPAQSVSCCHTPMREDRNGCYKLIS